MSQQAEYIEENDSLAPLRGIKWLLRNTPMGLAVLLTWCMVIGAVPTMMFIGNVAYNVFMGFFFGTPK